MITVATPLTISRLMRILEGLLVNHGDAPIKIGLDNKGTIILSEDKDGNKVFYIVADR